MLGSAPVPSPEQSMNGFPFDPSESAPPPLGPAISPHPSPRRSSLGELAEPLAPFGVRAAQPESPAPAEPHAPPPDLDLEPLPPLSREPDLGLDVELEPLTPLAPEIDAIDSGSGAVDDLPWISLDEPVEEVATGSAAPTLSEEMRAWDEWASAGAGEAAPEEAAPAPVPAPSLPAADSVAARLEEIARTLREHGPAGLLTGERSDPLHLFIAGYALGHAAAEEKGGAGAK
jgi:hypothetical protein